MSYSVLAGEAASRSLEHSALTGVFMSGYCFWSDWFIYPALASSALALLFAAYGEYYAHLAGRQEGA